MFQGVKKDTPKEPVPPCRGRGRGIGAVFKKKLPGAVIAEVNFFLSLEKNLDFCDSIKLKLSYFKITIMITQFKK